MCISGCGGENERLARSAPTQRHSRCAGKQEEAGRPGRRGVAAACVMACVARPRLGYSCVQLYEICADPLCVCAGAWPRGAVSFTLLCGVW